MDGECRENGGALVLGSLPGGDDGLRAQWGNAVAATGHSGMRQQGLLCLRLAGRQRRGHVAHPGRLLCALAGVSPPDYLELCSKLRREWDLPNPDPLLSAWPRHGNSCAWEAPPPPASPRDTTGAATVRHVGETLPSRGSSRSHRVTSKCGNCSSSVSEDIVVTYLYKQICLC